MRIKEFIYYLRDLFYHKPIIKKPNKEMHLRVDRTTTGKNHTNGKLYINGEFASHTLEDEKRDVKVMHRTRIPEGTYEIKFRKVGGHHQRYKQFYGEDFHKGMLELQDVPNFKFILIHSGNTSLDTSGCLLVGLTTHEPKDFVGQSRAAYKQIYPPIRNALLRGEKVTIEYRDIS